MTARKNSDRFISRVGVAVGRFICPHLSVSSDRQMSTLERFLQAINASEAPEQWLAWALANRLLCLAAVITT
jgi:hypothetical protein